MFRPSKSANPLPMLYVCLLFFLAVSPGLLAQTDLVGQTISLVGRSLNSEIRIAPAPPRDSTLPAKRALLIGINTYNPVLPPHCCDPTKKNCDPTDNSNPPGGIHNLCGPVSDVTSFQSILEKYYDFDASDVHLLTDSQASRKNILAGIQKYLLADTRPGDLSVFIFAGHGSQRFNSLSDKPGQWDQTIVPQDVLTGAEPIRDKELARLFKQILSKGVRLTAVFDSCYSGAITRGIPRGGVARFVFADDRDAKDAPDSGQTVEQMGAVVLSAAQPDESALEDAGSAATYPHGFFSSALGKALTTLPPDAPAIDLIRATDSLMASDNHPDQHPKLGGPERQPPFSFAGATRGPLTLAVKEVVGAHVKLDGGRELGIGEGSILREKSSASKVSNVGAAPETPAFELKILDASGMGLSLADVTHGNPSGIKVGSLFEIEKLAVPDTDRLRVWAPKPAGEAALASATVEIQKLSQSSRIDWVADPIKQSPTHVVEWNGDAWTVRSWNGKSEVIETLGPHLDAGVVLAQIGTVGGAKPKLFVAIPPTDAFWKSLATSLSLDSQSSHVALSARSDAHYLLVGRLNGDAIEYAWVLLGAVQDPKSPLVASEVKGESLCSPNTPLPLRSDWFAAGITEDSRSAAAGNLGDLALRLSRIVLMQNLTSSFDGSGFPYHLRLKNMATGTLLDSGVVHEGESYGYSLVADPSKMLLGVDARWVYVFSLDCTGKGQLTFPFASEGNAFNHLPLKTASGDSDAKPEIPLTGNPNIAKNGRFCVSEPFGLDTHFLLTSSTEIQDLSVFSFDAVLTRGASGTSDSNPLTRLVGRIQSDTRGGGTPEPAPTDWSIEKIHVESVANPRHPCPGESQ